MEEGESFKGRRLTGVCELKNKAPKHGIAVLYCPGPTLGELTLHDCSEIEHLPRFGVNNVIATHPIDWWVLSDPPTVKAFAGYANEQEHLRVLTVHLAGHSIEQACPGLRPGKTLYTVQTMPDFGRWEDGYRFYSRGTTAIAALEFLRYAGFRDVYIFGLDHFALADRHYHDRRFRPSMANATKLRIGSESTGMGQLRYKGKVPHTTPPLRRAAGLMNNFASRYWAGDENFRPVIVNSPQSQVTLPKIDMATFWERIDGTKGRGRPRQNNWTGSSGGAAKPVPAADSGAVQ